MLEGPNGGTAIGDRYSSAVRTELEAETLRHEFAAMAKAEQPAVVARLDTALDLVLKNLDVEGAQEGVLALWMPSELERAIAGVGDIRKSPLMTSTSWSGLIYLNGELRVIATVDIGLTDRHLPGPIASALQDTIDENTREPRPACPLHGHPLLPEGSLSGSVWVCPNDPQVWWPHRHLSRDRRWRQSASPELNVPPPATLREPWAVAPTG